MVRRSSLKGAQELRDFDGVQLHVVLPFGPGEELGFQVCGNAQQGIFICHVEPDSVAARGNLRIGDQILAVNGLRNITVDQAVTLHRSSGKYELELVIGRADKAELFNFKQRILWQYVNSRNTQEEPERWDIAAKVITIKVKLTSSSSKFSIRGGLECGTGVYISDVEKPSAAWKAGLRAGMRLVSVNNQSVVRISHEATCSLIGESLKRSKSVELAVQNLGRYPLHMSLDYRVAAAKQTAADDVSDGPRASKVDVLSAAVVNMQPPETESNDTDTTSNNDTANQSADSFNGQSVSRNSRTTLIGVGALLPSLLNETARDSLLRRDSPVLPVISITQEPQVQPMETNVTNVTAANTFSQAPQELPTRFERSRNNVSVSFAQTEPEMIPNGESLPKIVKNGINALDAVAKPSSSTPGIVTNTGTGKRKPFGRQKVAVSLDIPDSSDHKTDNQNRRKERHDRQAAKMLHSVSFKQMSSYDDEENETFPSKPPEKLNVRQNSKTKGQSKSLRPAKKQESTSSRSQSEYSSSSSDSDESVEVRETSRTRRAAVGELKKMSSQEDASSVRRESPANIVPLRDVVNSLSRTKRATDFWKKYSVRYQENDEEDPMKGTLTDKTDANSTLKKSTSTTSLSSMHRDPIKSIPSQIDEEEDL